MINKCSSNNERVGKQNRRAHVMRDQTPRTNGRTASYTLSSSAGWWTSPYRCPNHRLGVCRRLRPTATRFRVVIILDAGLSLPRQHGSRGRIDFITLCADCRCVVTIYQLFLYTDSYLIKKHFTFQTFPPSAPLTCHTISGWDPEDAMRQTTTQTKTKTYTYADK